jgi:hypothetical protein
LVLKEKAVGQDSLWFPAALALPLLGLVLYLAFYMGGLSGFGKIELAPRVIYSGPIPHLAFAAIISFGLSWYGATRLPAALACAAVLFVLTSLISIGQSAAIQQVLEKVPPDLRSLLLAVVPLTASVLIGAAVMLVAGAAVPALHTDASWVIAVILWPVAGFLIFGAAQGLTVSWQVDRSSIPHLYFAALLVKQCIFFACIGYWLDDIASGALQSAGKTASPYPPA